MIAASLLPGTKHCNWQILAGSSGPCLSIQGLLQQLLTEASLHARQIEMLHCLGMQVQDKRPLTVTTFQHFS